MKKIFLLVLTLHADSLSASVAGGGAASSATTGRQAGQVQTSANQAGTKTKNSRHRVNILHGALDYIPEKADQSAVAVSTKQIRLDVMAEEYLRHLKTGTDNDDLHDLISPQTEQYGFHPFGFTAADIAIIKAKILQKLSRSNIQKFAFYVLPKWLRDTYKNITYELLADVLRENLEALNEYAKHFSPKDTAAKSSDAPQYLLPNIPESIMLGVAQCMLQEWNIKNVGHNTFFYQKMDTSAATKDITDSKKYIHDALLAVKKHFAYIDPELPLRYFIQPLTGEVDFLQGNNDIEYLIIPYAFRAHANYLQTLKLLRSALLKKPELKVIIAFDDQATIIPNTFYLPNLFDANIVYARTQTHHAPIQDPVQKNRDAYYNIIIIGASLTTIENGFMQGCMSLWTLTLPNGLIRVEDYFLQNCVNLRGIWLPEGFTSAGKDFLRNCQNLQTLTFPKSFITVKPGFLFYCNNLKTIKMSRQLAYFLKIKNKIFINETNTRASVTTYAR